MQFFYKTLKEKSNSQTDYYFTKKTIFSKTIFLYDKIDYGDKMKFLSIASGSKGNCSYIETANYKILIDAGIPYTRIANALKENDVDVKDLTHLFITHEHSDHVNGLKILLKNANPTIYVSKGTNAYLKLTSNVQIIKALEPLYFENLTVTPIPLSHDAKEPLGFVFKNDVKSICYITDTGYINKDLLGLLHNHNLYYLESNHDPYLLRTSRRPYHLIKRILNEKGHLSNEDSAYYFSKMKGDNTKYVIHAHISEECNNQEAIKNTYQQVLMTQGVSTDNLEFLNASQVEPLKVIKL